MRYKLRPDFTCGENESCRVLPGSNRKNRCSFGVTKKHKTIFSRHRCRRRHCFFALPNVAITAHAPNGIFSFLLGSNQTVTTVFTLINNAGFIGIGIHEHIELVVG